MGKTKTAFVKDTEEVKTSEQKYKEKREKQKKEAGEKVHISGLKGGQRVKIISTEEPETATSTSTESLTKVEKKTIVEKIRGKKYQEVKSKIEIGKNYSVKDAVKLVKETSYSKFEGTMELHLVVKKIGSFMQVTLPHSTGKTKKIEVASDDTIAKLRTGKIDFDILLSTADMMPKLVAFAKVLGPKGLMPNPKNGTIIKNAKEADKFGGNSINLKTEKDAPLIHTIVGKSKQDDKKLVENIETILKSLGGEKQVVRAYLKSTMSPSVKLAV